MESRRKDVHDNLESERRARERRELEQAAGGRGKKTSTLHRESDFTLECPDDRVSPARVPTTRTAGETTRKDMAVRYGPSRDNENPARLREVENGDRQRQSEPLGEFERRLLNAKRLGKAPMPNVEQIS